MSVLKIDAEIELKLMVEWLKEEHIANLSSGEKSFFRFLRDVNFDAEFAEILRKQFSHLWERLLGEAKEKKDAWEFSEDKRKYRKMIGNMERLLG